jgi:hypothetical protein
MPTNYFIDFLNFNQVIFCVLQNYLAQLACL